MAIPEDPDVGGHPAAADTAGETAAVTEQDEQQLDVDTDTLLQELASSSAEVQRMLQQHQDQSLVLGGLKDKLAAELSELQEEAWRLQAYNELEVLKRQLEALNSLEADLDAAEAVLEAADEQEDGGAAAGGTPAASGSKGTAAAASAAEACAPPAGAEVSSSAAGRASGQAGDSAGGADGGSVDDDAAAVELAEVAALQAQLDQELAQMLAQLNVVRTEATAVSARKAALEAELHDLLALQARVDAVVGDVAGSDQADEATAT